MQIQADADAIYRLWFRSQSPSGTRRRRRRLRRRLTLQEINQILKESALMDSGTTFEWHFFFGSFASNWNWKLDFSRKMRRLFATVKRHKRFQRNSISRLHFSLYRHCVKRPTNSTQNRRQINSKNVDKIALGGKNWTRSAFIVAVENKKIPKDAAS